MSNKIKAKEVLSDIKNGMDNTGLIEKYQITPAQLISIFARMCDAGLLTQEDIDRRSSQQDSKTVKSFWEKTVCTLSEKEDFFLTKGKKVWENAYESAGGLAQKGKFLFKDDVEMIRKDCCLLNDWINTKESTSVTQAAILAAAGTGILANEVQLARLSRSIMDTDSSVFQKTLEMFFDKQEVAQISAWMDTVPGNTVAGGGVTHRVLHGHDVSELIELFQEHDLAGIAEWFNHVALRDFFTPAGVPYLPYGSNSVYEWLCSLGVSKSTAADLLSVNFWEVMGILMIYRSSKLFYKIVRDKINARKMRELWDRAGELEGLEDFDAANQCYDQVLSHVSDKAEVIIWVAMNYLQRARQCSDNLWKSNMLRAYQLADAARLKLSKDKPITYYGGIKLSLRGLSASIMVSSWGCFAEENNLFAIKGVIASAIEDLLKMANKLKDKWNSRPFSAVANEALALKLMVSSPFALSTPFSPEHIHKRIVDSLNAIALDVTHEAAYAKELVDGFCKRYPMGLLEQKAM